MPPPLWFNKEFRPNILFLGKSKKNLCKTAGDSFQKRTFFMYCCVGKKTKFQFMYQIVFYFCLKLCGILKAILYRSVVYKLFSHINLYSFNLKFVAAEVSFVLLYVVSHLLEVSLCCKCVLVSRVSEVFIRMHFVVYFYLLLSKYWANI